MRPHFVLLGVKGPAHLISLSLGGGLHPPFLHNDPRRIVPNACGLPSTGRKDVETHSVAIQSQGADGRAKRSPFGRLLLKSWRHVDLAESTLIHDDVLNAFEPAPQRNLEQPPQVGGRQIRGTSSAKHQSTTVPLFINVAQELRLELVVRPK